MVNFVLVLLRRLVSAHVTDQSSVSRNRILHLSRACNFVIYAYVASHAGGLNCD